MGTYVDMDSAIEELGLDKEDFIEFTGDLKEFLDESIPELESVVSSMDFVGIKEKAHAIKGAMANLRFVKAADVAMFLETAGRNSDPADVPEKLAELKATIEASFSELAEDG